MSTDATPYILIDTHDDGIEIPREVAICPTCERSLILSEIEAYEVEVLNGVEVGMFIERGFTVSCESEMDTDSTMTRQQFAEWIDWHYSTPYMDWFPLYAVICQWLNQHYRIRL